MNKKLPFLFSFLLSIFLMNSLALKAQEDIESDTSSFAQMEFENFAFNFGELNQGEKAEHIFKFRNIGKAPLIINNVLATCGCTAPEWPKDPIQPGAEGEVKVVFDSSSKIGRQNKVITIRSNAKSGDYRLRISAMVLPPKK
ncbi:MAG: DUF1573 domain-containing protein [Cyclobacteriaceae bacterium]|nr:DUF1573 domain-containing protein [Cyclobacteriaceae bacterium]MCK5277539.1 DUF1573 domain-containing protein [Cyclobacteriaceae bacterium]MCK5699542.1 DUF1573 domain-containing protein [Cyclobacteriaceae bacterium]